MKIDMNNEWDGSEDFDDGHQAELEALLTLEILSLPPPPKALEERLLARVAQSTAEHADLLTVRAGQGEWRMLRDGIRYKPLWRGNEGSSVLVEMQPGASLPRHRHAWLEEGIVLNGQIEIGSQVLTSFDYHMSPPGSRHEPVRSQQGALAYLRGTSLGDVWSELRELSGGLLPFSGDPSHTIVYSDSDWFELLPGVMKKILWTDGVKVSYFCRIDAGVVIEGHPHALEEECLMLSGDLFLGDILLQAGDYQLAPAGSRHGNIGCDNGALLFVRGAA